MANQTGCLLQYLTILIFYCSQNIDDELDKSDDLSLHLENIMKVCGAEGESLWKSLASDPSFSMVEYKSFEQRHSKTLLQDLFQQWLEQPGASWKVLVDALRKAPPPGPKIAETIVTTHRQLVKEEEDERTLYGAQPLMAEREKFNFESIKRNDRNINAAIQSLDPLDAKLQEKIDEVKDRLRKTNDEFLTEVKRGTDYWKKIRDEDYMIRLSIADKLDEVDKIFRESHAALIRVVDHYKKYLLLEKKLLIDLQTAKSYFNDPYYKQLQVRIERLEQLGSNKQIYLIQIRKVLQALSSMFVTAEENYLRCSELTTDDRKYILQLKKELTAVGGALNRIRSNMEKLKDLKEQELHKWYQVKMLVSATGVAGLFLALVTAGVGLALSGTAVATYVCIEAYTSDSKAALDEYERQIAQCVSRGHEIQKDTTEVQNLWITDV